MVVRRAITGASACVATLALAAGIGTGPPAVATAAAGPDCTASPKGMPITGSAIARPGGQRSVAPAAGKADEIMYGVAEVAPNDVWTVGGSESSNGKITHAIIEHFDGAAWTRIDASLPDDENSYLSGVTAIASDDVWAVGYIIEPERDALVLHWDGVSWTRVTGPAVAGTLSGLTAFAGNDVWAVGSRDVGQKTQPLTEHWDGKSWTLVAAPGTKDRNVGLGSIDGASSDDLWAVGSTGNGVGIDTFSEHWDGTAWSIVPTPHPGMSNDENWLSDVDVDSSGAVRAIGTWITGGGACGRPFVLTWNGKAWHRTASVNTPIMQTCTLEALTSTSANDGWAVGGCDGRRISMLVEHWNGSTWSRVPVPEPGGKYQFEWLTSVTALTPTEAWLAGGREYPPYQPFHEHWDGTSWQVG